MKSDRTKYQIDKNNDNTESRKRNIDQTFNLNDAVWEIIVDAARAEHSHQKFTTS